MNLAKKLLMTTGTSSGTVPTPSGGYVDDVFSTYLYTGNGSTQTINNGIDLAGKGGLVWIKCRNGATTNHSLSDTARGAQKRSQSNNTFAEASNTSYITTFNSNGFSIGSGGDINSGVAGFTSLVSWTFRKAPKFFDVVTYTGNGATGRQIAHSLGVPGFITVKSTSEPGDWNSYHRSATGDLKLNLTDAQTASRAIITAADASTFTVSGTANNNGVSYVAYLWAHDPSTDGIIQCGSVSYPGSGQTVVNLGWEPQFVLFKGAGTSEWKIIDQMRGWSSDDTGQSKTLSANSSAADSSGSWGKLTATGFTVYTWNTGAGIYLAIRRPNKPPTSGTQVYNATTYTGAGTNPVVSNGAGFTPDFVSNFSINQLQQGAIWFDRLRGGSLNLEPRSTGAENSQTESTVAFGMDGVSLTGGDVNTSGTYFINHFFRRATGFMDVVCDTGTGVAHAIAHNLTKVPELIIRKSRSAATQWEVWHSALAATEKLVLNSNSAKATDATAWNSTLPTATQFTVGTGANVNANTATFVTYLFATLAGVSKVGSYNGNGGTQTIPCGFTTGSRFILIKRIDNTGDWFVWDTTRGITPTTDPHLSLNTTAAEVTTDDSIDQDASGFVVNQNAATNINALGGNYLFLAIA